MEPNGLDDFRDRLAQRADGLSPSALKVARFIDGNRTAVIASSASRLASRIGTSDATVVRSVQALGFRGLNELKETLAATLDELPTPADNMRRTFIETKEGSDAAIEDALSVHAEALVHLRSRECVAAMASAVATLAGARRIVIFGIGPSAFLAGYMGVLLGRIGRRSLVLDVNGRALADPLLDLHTDDAVFMLSYGSPYAEAKAVVSESLRLGLPLVVTTDDAAGALARQADVVVLAPRGRTARVALHAGTTVVIEAIVLGLASCDRARALHALDRLDALRDLVVPVTSRPRGSGRRRGSTADRDPSGGNVGGHAFGSDAQGREDGT